MIHLNLKNLLFLSILFTIFFISRLTYADKLKTDISHEKIALGETLMLTYTLDSHASRSTPDFSALQEDFRIIGTDYGNVVNMVNGVISVQTYWRLTLDPKRSGKIIIPEISFGQEKSDSHQLMVEEKVYTQADKPAFVQAEINSAQAYVQSQILYTFKLFYQTQLENPRLEIPTMKEGTFIQLNTNKHYETMIQGKIYNVVEKLFAFFPQKSGELTLPSTKFHAMYYDIKGNVISNPFYINTPKSLSLKTQNFKLHVRDIPDKFQGTTWLPAENMTVVDKWSVPPDQWELNTPVTRTLSVEAKGLRADQIPDFTVDNIAGVNVYIDPPKRSHKIYEKTVVGILEQKITYIPHQTQTLKIPNIKLPWWNLKTDKEEVIELKEITAIIKGSLPPLVTSLPLKKHEKISKSANQLPDQSRLKDFYMSIWFWLASFLALAWGVTLYFLWKKNKKLVFQNDTSNKKQKTQISDKISKKQFKQACYQGDAILAQQFLFSWIRKQYPHLPLSLEKIADIFEDNNFKNAVKQLETIIYAKKSQKWNGYPLYTAFQTIKKHKKITLLTKSKSKKNAFDPLPSLNPKSSSIQ